VGVVEVHEQVAGLLGQPRFGRVGGDAVADQQYPLEFVERDTVEAGEQSEAKKTWCWSASKGRRPGNGDRSSDHPDPPWASTSRNCATKRVRASSASSPSALSCCSRLSSGCRTPRSTCSGRLPSAIAVDTSHTHHADAIEALLTRHMAASAQRSRS
jgi:hypothetical protein